MPYRLPKRWAINFPFVRNVLPYSEASDTCIHRSLGRKLLKYRGRSVAVPLLRDW
jgi:hypothetical protein